MAAPDSLGPLLACVRQGDRAAQDALWEHLRRYAHGLARQEHCALPGTGLTGSDIVQLTLVAAFNGFGQFRGSTSAELLGWIRTIFRHVLASAGRGRKLFAEEMNHDLPAAGPTPSEVVAAAEQSEQDRLRLVAAVERLAEHRRAVIQLRIFEGLPFAEVAQRLGKSAEACRVLWVRALADLRRELEDRS